MKLTHKVDYHVLSELSAMHFVGVKESRRIHAEVDPNDEVAVKNMIRRLIVPYLDEAYRQVPTFKNQLKETLRYYLTKRSLPYPIGDVFGANEPVIEGPANLWDYYLWAWQVLFPNEDWQLASLEDYVEINCDQAP